MFEGLMYYPQNEDFWKQFGFVVNYQYLSLKIDEDKFTKHSLEDLFNPPPKKKKKN